MELLGGFNNMEEERIVITKIEKDLDQYSDKELKEGLKVLIGFGYNGNIEYFDKPATEIVDIGRLAYNQFNGRISSMDRDVSDTAYMCLKSLLALGTNYMKFNGSNGFIVIKRKINNKLIDYDYATISEYKKRYNLEPVEENNEIVADQPEVISSEVTNNTEPKENNERKFYAVKLNNNVHPVPTYSGFGHDPWDNGQFADIVESKRDVKIKKGLFEKTITEYSYNGATIIAEEVNGKMYDVVTGEEIIKCDLNPGERKCSEVNGLSYSGRTKLTKKNVVDMLSRYQPDDIERYRKYLYDTKNESMRLYNNKYPGRVAQEEKERYQKDLEDNFNDFMDKFQQRRREF